jgi:CRISPR-associated endonuclease/helicase Cas3
MSDNGSLLTIAHARIGKEGAWEKPHLLVDHINGVAQLAGKFASSFGNEDWGQLAGLWHDLGKYKPEFQDYIRKVTGYDIDEACEGGPGRVDHSIVGALWARQQYGDYAPSFWRTLAYLIAGHHAGLPDWSHEIGIGGALADRLRDASHLSAAMAGDPPAEILQTQLAMTPPGGRAPSADGDDELGKQLHLWIRMLFSCLVDADFLDTEAYMNPADSRRRNGSGISLNEAKAKLDAHLRGLALSAPDTSVNIARQKILSECRAKAGSEPGLFSLTVPTGGGKTLAGMAFALEHALAHGKKRVVVAIPYTSIIEQTAETYRTVFGDDSVIEHHSNLDPNRETPSSKLASENWDAPIIVATNVQLFESLFSSRTSACRKLHNLVDSVIILDEAQIQPVGLLEPIVCAMRGLVEYFGASIVLSTATQPALAGKIESGTARLSGFAVGSVREIISNPAGFSKSLRRVEIVRRKRGEEAPSWADIAAEVESEERVLCIVNTRKDCRELHGLLPEGTIHLSALMCPEHRSEIVANIKSKLSEGGQIRVVSTQLVEAGVDIDFPVVYRALAGLDSIAQAAGRCNREGLLNNEGRLGKVIVFDTPKPAPPGALRKGQDTGEEMLRLWPEEVARLDPEAFKKYFKLFYGRANSFDEKGIMRLLAGPDVQEAKIQFRSAATKFSMIEDGGQRAVVCSYYSARSIANPSLSADSLAAKIEAFGPDRATMRRLQRYTVNVPSRVFNTLLEMGAVRGVKNVDGLYIQSRPGLYDPVFGLRLEGPKFDPLDFIA